MFTYTTVKSDKTSQRNSRLRQTFDFKMRKVVSLFTKNVNRTSTSLHNAVVQFVGSSYPQNMFYINRSFPKLFLNDPCSRVVNFYLPAIRSLYRNKHVLVVIHCNQGAARGCQNLPSLSSDQTYDADHLCD